MERATETAYAHLGRHPSDFIYIANDADEVHDIITCDEYYTERSALHKSRSIREALLILSCVSFTGSIAFDLGFMAIGVFAGIALMYLLLVLTGIQSAGEGSFACLIMLVMFFCMIPLVEAVRVRAKESSRKTGADTSQYLYEQGTRITEDMITDKWPNRPKSCFHVINS